ncbi:prepilin peptidase [uncultured Megasphaera sp.]|uniref:prepilin peptidase n=1 Tax=Megasphaera massiliensis TaxID=1232428 RepID=UPI00266CDB2D|nr:prepilin peptidase [uncultured Megasphaera sp.]
MDLFGLWYALAFGATAVITYTDVKAYWIPNAPVVVLAVGNILALGLGLVRPSILAVSATVFFFLLLYGLWPDSIGSGDIKLALALSIGCPASGAWIMTVVSFLLATVIALICWGVKGKTILPFGPFLLLGWWLSQEFHFNWLNVGMGL